MVEEREVEPEPGAEAELGIASESAPEAPAPAGPAALPPPTAFPPPPRRRGLRVALLALGLALIAGGTWEFWTHREEVVAAALEPLGLRLVEGHAERIRAAARESNVDPLLLAAIMFMESRGRSGQRSSADALGLMQLRMPSARDAARRLGLPEPGEDDVLNDPDLNVRLGAAHVAWLLENSEGWPLERVLVSYNAGRARLFRWERDHGGWEGWKAREERRAARGEPTTGSLAYARRALEVMERFRERGGIVGAGG